MTIRDPWTYAETARPGGAYFVDGPPMGPIDLTGVHDEYLVAYAAAQAEAADLIWRALSHGQEPDRIHYPRIDYWTRDGV